MNVQLSSRWSESWYTYEAGVVLRSFSLFLWHRRLRLLCLWTESTAETVQSHFTVQSFLPSGHLCILQRHNKSVHHTYILGRGTMLSTIYSESTKRIRSQNDDVQSTAETVQSHRVMYSLQSIRHICPGAESTAGRRVTWQTVDHVRWRHR